MNSEASRHRPNPVRCSEAFAAPRSSDYSNSRYAAKAAPVRSSAGSHPASPARMATHKHFNRFFHP